MSVSGSVTSKKYVLQGSVNASNMTMALTNDNYSIALGNTNIFNVSKNGTISNYLGSNLVTSDVILATSNALVSQINQAGVDLTPYAPKESPTFTGTAIFRDIIVEGTTTIVDTYAATTSNMTISSEYGDALTVIGTANFTSNVTFGSNLIVTKGISASSLAVTGSSTFSSTLGVTGALTAGSLAATGSSTFSSTLSVGGLATFNSNLVVSGSVSASSLKLGGFEFILQSTSNLVITYANSNLFILNNYS